MEGTSHIMAPLEGKHTHTIIFLHGRDSTSSEFAEEFFESQASDDRTLPQIFPTVKWVFPSSKIRTSARFETEMSQWFDMWLVEQPSEKEEIQIDGLKDSVGDILAIISSEALLVPPSRIFLGGISQGCATAIHALLRGGIQLGGFVGLCSWLPFKDNLAAISNAFSKNDRLHQIQSMFDKTTDGPNVRTDHSNPSGELAFETPIFLSHSQDDDVVPINNGRELCRVLEDLGFVVGWKEYDDGGHWIKEPQGVDDIVAFLEKKVQVL